MSECVNCGTETNKYRCKICPEFTCSLACHKAHEVIDCGAKLIKPNVDNVSMQPSNESSIIFKTEDTVEPQKLKELENNDKLKNLLRNPHLREFLFQIDKSTDAWKAMKIAMLEPLFVEFANECLNVVEPDL